MVVFVQMGLMFSLIVFVDPSLNFINDELAEKCLNSSLLINVYIYKYS